jgi:hypothetical protein
LLRAFALYYPESSHVELLTALGSQRDQDDQHGFNARRRCAWNEQRKADE